MGGKLHDYLADAPAKSLVLRCPFKEALKYFINNRRHSGNLPSDFVVAHSFSQKLAQSLACAVGVLNVLRTIMFSKIEKSPFFPSFFDILSSKNILEIHEDAEVLTAKFWKQTVVLKHLLVRDTVRFVDTACTFVQ